MKNELFHSLCVSTAPHYLVETVSLLISFRWSTLSNCKCNCYGTVDKMWYFWHLSGVFTILHAFAL